MSEQPFQRPASFGCDGDVFKAPGTASTSGTGTTAFTSATDSSSFESSTGFAMSVQSDSPSASMGSLKVEIFGGRDGECEDDHHEEVEREDADFESAVMLQEEDADEPRRLQEQPQVESDLFDANRAASQQSLPQPISRTAPSRMNAADDTTKTNTKTNTKNTTKKKKKKPKTPPNKKKKKKKKKS